MSDHSDYESNLNKQISGNVLEEKSACSSFSQKCFNTILWPFPSKNNKRQSVELAFFIMMVLSLFLAIVVPLIIYSLVDSGINEQVVIDSTSSPNYDSWQTNVNNEDLAVTYDLYYFDIQNPAEVLQGAKPVVTEVGPYAFREYFNKFDINWSDDGDTVTYNTQRYYVFDPERTDPGLSLQDKITLPYPTVIGFQYLISQIPGAATQLVNTLINDKVQSTYRAIEQNITILYNSVSGLSIKKQQEERKLIVSLNNTINLIYKRLFDFVNESDPADLVLKVLLCNVTSGISPFWQTDPVSAWFGWLNDPVLMEVQRILNATHMDIPWTSAVPGATVNWTTVEDTRRRRGPDTLKTGKKNPKQVGQYVKFNNMQRAFWTCVNPTAMQDTSAYIEGSEFPACPIFQTDWTDEEATANGYVLPFETDYANRIQGTNGDMFGRPVTTEKVQIFVNDIYRSCYLSHTEDTDWGGVNLHRFELQLKDLENATLNPTNAQYYNFGHNGVENATKAANIPLFISFPHFYGADKSLVSAVKGLSPHKESHLTYLDIEPQTGLLARASKKLQVNYLMESDTLPSTAPDGIIFADQVCGNLTASIVQLNSILPKNKRIQVPACNDSLAEIIALLTCLQKPSTWTFQDNQVYFPYGWANEALNLPESDATDIKTSLFGPQDFADGFRFWCLVVATACLLVLAVMLIEDYAKKYNGMRISGWSHSLSSFGSNGSGGGQKRQPAGPSWAVQAEPLLTQSVPTWNSPPTKSGFSFST